MKRRVVLVLAALLIAGVSGAIFYKASQKEEAPPVTSTPKDSSMKNKEGMAAPQNTKPAKTSSPSTSPGKYVVYSEDALVKAQGRRVLFFYAQWCPQCRALEADIKAKGVPDDMTILKVDYDNAQSLRQKYGVTLQTTMVEVDQSGNLVKKHVAYDEPTLAAVLDALGR